VAQSSFFRRLRDAGRVFFGPQPGRDRQPPADDPAAAIRNASPATRAVALGHAPQYPLTDHANELRHNTGWTYPAVRAIGRQYAQASVTVYDASRVGRKGSRLGYITKEHAADAPAEERTPVQDHPIARLMKRPNKLKSGHEWRYQIAQQVALTGGCVIWELRNELGQPLELYVLPRGWLTYQTPSERFPLGTWRVYPSRVAAGAWTTGLAGAYATGFHVDVRETIFFGWPDALVPGEFTSPMAACDRIIDIAEQADEATWAALVNAPRPGMILSVDQVGALSPQQLEAIKSEIELHKSGSANAGKTLVLQNVRKEDLGTPISELQAVDVRNQALEQTLLVHGVPTLVIGKLDGATYSGNAAAVNAWVELGIAPDLALLGGVLTHRWQSLYGRDFSIEFNPKRYDDPTLDLTKTDKLLAAFDKGVVTGNEVRASLKLPPRPDLDELKAPEPAPGGMPGDPNGAPAGAAPDSAADPFDLGMDDLSDDDTTGTADASKAGMPRATPRFSLPSRNGSANGVAH
jgi:phage portal protein BeeE